MKTLLIVFTMLLTAVACLACGVVIGVTYQSNLQGAVVRSYADCVAKGYPVLDSYPEQCQTPQGITFVRPIAIEPITVTGEIICLPHRDTTGPQTAECAFGLKALDGKNYGLRDVTNQLLTDMPTGSEVAIKGRIERNADDPSQIYDIVGTIEIDSLIKN